MEKSLKQLLLKDICARLLYGVRGKVKADTIVPHKYDTDGFPLETTFDVNVELQRIDISNDEVFVSTFDNDEDLGIYIEECQIEGTPWTVEEFIPYLRPMSSMTKEERLVYEQRLHDVGRSIDVIDADDVVSHIDWLLSHHFDYRGLIEKGLAIEAPEGIYK